MTQSELEQYKTQIQLIVHKLANVANALDELEELGESHDNIIDPPVLDIDDGDIEDWLCTLNECDEELNTMMDNLRANL